MFLKGCPGSDARPASFLLSHGHILVLFSPLEIHQCFLWGAFMVQWKRSCYPLQPEQRTHLCVNTHHCSPKLSPAIFTVCVCLVLCNGLGLLSSSSQCHFMLDNYAVHAEVSNSEVLSRTAFINYYLKYIIHFKISLQKT